MFLPTTDGEQFDQERISQIVDVIQELTEDLTPGPDRIPRVLRRAYVRPAEVDRLEALQKLVLESIPEVL